jgi:protein arginine N-methyltransferase 1
MRALVAKEGLYRVCVADPGGLITPPCVAVEWDLNTVTDAQLDFAGAFEIVCNSSGAAGEASDGSDGSDGSAGSAGCELQALCVSFDNTFGVEGGEAPVVRLPTGPSEAPTHWKQTLLYLEQPLRLREGDAVRGTLRMRRGSENPRHLDIEATYSLPGGEAVTQKWHMG